VDSADRHPEVHQLEEVLIVEAVVIPEEENNMNDLFAGLFDWQVIYDFVHPEGALYLVVILVVLFLAKWIHNLLTPYKIDAQLTEEDNKAVALSFSGYLFGVGIVILGVYSNPAAPNLYKDLLDTLIWGLIGIVLLKFSYLINDKILLGKFKNVKELVTDKNVGTGAVEWGSYVGAALIIYACLIGEDESFMHGILSTLIYFVMGQVGFIIFGWLYQLISRYDLHAEIEKDNVSAGVAFGLNLTAVAILLSGYILRYDSLFGFVVWMVLSFIFLIVSRYLVDKILLPGSLLDEEISRDQNWGAALVEGGVAISLALLLVPTFLD
jgi:uncharacterized membrane protein YjfL (UPF0719 family)